jgi:hypothetical protein
MGNYIITIQGVGGHGQDRNKKNGENVDFGENTPEAIIKEAVDKLKATGNSISQATFHHWPNSEHQVVDDLLTGHRLGDF